MKRLLCMLLAGSRIVSMTGCSRDTLDSSVSFYYPRAEFNYGASDGVMVAETHEVPGHTDDLRYLLALYLLGPSDQELQPTFPSGTILVDVIQDEQEVTVILSSSVTALEGIDLTLACACLAETCFAVCDAQQVHIESLVSASGKYVDTTITRDNILFPGYEILPDDSE